MSNHVLLEIGIEELPARFIDQASAQLVAKTEKWLDELHISYDKITAYSTPRRLAFVIENIAEAQTAIVEEARGPQMKIAKDADGNWSKAAQGFARGQGKSTEDLYVKTIKDVDYIFVEKTTDSQKTIDILPSLNEIIKQIHFPQTMRWGSGSERFARPIRWIVALYNDQIVPLSFGNVSADNKTYGHRFLGSSTRIENPLTYEKQLTENYVIADPVKREKMIVDQIKAIEAKEGFSIEIDAGLLNEVRNLVEYPTAFFGSFAADYLRLPEEALITSMKEHQRYFPVKDNETNALLPYFVSVRNGNDTALDNVVRGNEKVLRARLADGAFFYDEDRAQSIEFYNQKLETVVFQEKIGTIAEKIEHIKVITAKLADQLQLSEEEKAQAIRAAEISKFDLVTNMVNEFPELQGIMGEKYALHFGEDSAVATAVREHYLPIAAHGELPSSTIGAIVSIADKLDTIIGCISVGLTPTGSQDPLGLRRQAIGIMRILLDRNWSLTMESLIEEVCELYDITIDDIRQEIMQFFVNRASFILTEQKVEQDIIQAVLANGIGMLAYKVQKAKLLSQKRNDPAFKEIEESFTRIMNLGKKHHETKIDVSLLQTATEKKLYEKYEEVAKAYIAYEANHDVENALQTLATLAEPIKQFFEHNMVMDKDEQIKRNRLALVHTISNLIKTFADVTLVEWKQHQ